MSILSSDHFELVEMIFGYIPHSRDRFNVGIVCKDMHNVLLDFNRRYIAQIESDDECLVQAARNGDPIIAKTSIDFSPPRRIELFSEVCSSGNINLFMHIDSVCKENEDTHPKGKHITKMRRFMILQNIFRYNLVNSKNGNCIKQEHLDAFTIGLWNRMNEECADTALNILKHLSPCIIVYGEGTDLHHKYCSTKIIYEHSYARNAMSLHIAQEYFYSGNYEAGKKVHTGNSYVYPIVESAIQSPVKNKDIYRKNLKASLKLDEKKIKGIMRSGWIVVMLSCALRKSDESVDIILDHIKSSHLFDKVRNDINYEKIWARAEKRSERNIDKYIDMWNLDLKKCLVITLDESLRAFERTGRITNQSYINHFFRTRSEVLSEFTDEELQRYPFLVRACPKCDKMETRPNKNNITIDIVCKECEL